MSLNSYQQKILIVDDEESLRSFMEIMLSKAGYEVSSCASGHEALRRLDDERYDLVVSDLMMPEMSGLELLSKAKSKNAQQEFIVMTAFGSLNSAVEAMKLGAADYITKPFNVEEVKLAINRTLDRAHLEQENSQLKRELQKDKSFDHIIGVSESIQQVKKLATQISSSDTTALIRGESGVGKDLFARAIHNTSARSSGPFITLNCAALPENLLESELFGYKKGAFTGAIRDKDGLFQAADGGTLFLDEIGDVSPAMQAKLLRVLEDQLVTPVGATKPIKVDVRLIAATNVNLEEAVKAGRFRHDLYYRLNVIQLDIPSLRERPDDVSVLAERFLTRFSERMQKPGLALSDEARAMLQKYTWPGNVRELENTIERAALLCKSALIGVGDLPERLRKSVESTADDPPITPDKIISSAAETTPTLESIEKAYIHFVMAQSGGNKTKAAKALGIDASTLYRRLEKYGWNKSESGDGKS